MSLTSRRTVMARKRYKPEEIVAKLRQVDVLVSQGPPWPFVDDNGVQRFTKILANSPAGCYRVAAEIHAAATCRASTKPRMLWTTYNFSRPSDPRKLLDLPTAAHRFLAPCPVARLDGSLLQFKATLPD